MLAAAAATAAATLIASHAHAATATWTGGGGTNNWSDAANWGGTPPVSGVDSVAFDGALQTTNNNDFVNAVFKGINFATTAGAFTLNGNPVKLTVQTTGTGITSASDVVNGSTNDQLLNIGLALDPGKHLITTGANALNLHGAITRVKGSAVGFSSGGGVINVAGSGLVNDGSAAGGLLGGWGFIVGNATTAGNFATIDGSNNIVAYTGYTNLAGGATVASDATSNFRINAGSGTAITMAAGGTTNINTLLYSAGTAAQTVTVGAGNTLVLGQNGGIHNATATAGGTLRNLTIGTGTLTAGDGVNPANITLSSSPLPSVSGVITVSSAITDNGAAPVSVTVMGGYVTLTGTNTYSGGTYILSGRVSQPTGATFGTGPIHLFAGGHMNPGGGVNVTIPNDMFIAGNGTSENNGLGAVRMFQNTDGNSTLLTGTVTLTDTASISSNGNNNPARNVGVTGRITGPGGLMIGSPVTNSGNGTGVVDTDLKFEAYDNLYCADPSVWPFIPAANPSLTLVALSLRLSEHLRTQIT